jgi:hypothetical protein
MSEVYCRSCGHVGEEVNGMCSSCGGIEIQMEPDEYDLGFEGGGIDDEIDECDINGHDWILSGPNAGLCANCGIQQWEEDGP